MDTMNGLMYAIVDDDGNLATIQTMCLGKPCAFVALLQREEDALHLAFEVERASGVSHRVLPLSNEFTAESA